MQNTALSFTPKSPQQFLFLTPLFLSLSIILDTKLLTHTHLRDTEGLTYLLVSDVKVI